MPQTENFNLDENELVVYTTHYLSYLPNEHILQKFFMKEYLWQVQGKEAQLKVVYKMVWTKIKEKEQ